MIKTAVCKGKKVEVENGLAKPSKGGFAWIYATEPTQDELHAIGKKFNISQKTLEHYKQESRSKRYSSRPLEFVLVDYYIENERVESAKLLFVLKKDTLITITNKKSNYYNSLFQRVLEAVKVKSPSIGTLMFEFLGEDIEDNYEVLRKNEETIVKMEEQAVEFKEQGVPAREIVRLKRSLFKMSRRFWSSAKIVFLMRKGLTPLKIDSEGQNMLDDIYDTLVHQIDVIATQQEMASDILTVYMARLSNEISSSVKKLTYITLVLTGITAVLTVPNTLATIFGIPYFPRELGEGVAWEYILALLVLSTIVSSFLLYSYWKKHGLTKEGK